MPLICSWSDEHLECYLCKPTSKCPVMYKASHHPFPVLKSNPALFACCSDEPQPLFLAHIKEAFACFCPVKYAAQVMTLIEMWESLFVAGGDVAQLKSPFVVPPDSNRGRCLNNGGFSCNNPIP